MAKLRRTGLAAACLAGVLLALVFTAALCLPCAAIFGAGVLPLSIAPAAAQAAAGVAVMLSVFTVARVRRRQALPTAGLTAAGCLLVCLPAGAALCAGEPAEAWSWPLAGCIICGGMIGALLSIRRNPHKKRIVRAK